MNHHNWLPAFTWDCLASEQHVTFGRCSTVTALDVPVMLSTIVGLELLLQEPSIDLDTVAALILNDVGATMQILRLVGNDYVSDGDRPKRMRDCLASLDVDFWFKTISSQSVRAHAASPATVSLWNHSQSIAHYSKLVAMSLHDVSPEDAYLVGLLHEIRSIPDVLGWKASSHNAENYCASASIERSVPLFVLAALRCVRREHPVSVWKLMLSEAHIRANSECQLAVCTSRVKVSTRRQSVAEVGYMNECALAG